MTKKAQTQVKPAVYVFKNGRWVNVTQGNSKPKFFVNGNKEVR